MTFTPQEPEPALDPSEEPDEPAGFHLGDLMAQAVDIHQQLLEVQAAVADEVLEGRAGGGAVKVLVTGDLTFQSVLIDPAIVDPDDVEMLQDLVLAAIRDALVQVNELKAEAIGGFSGAIGGLLP